MSKYLPVIGALVLIHEALDPARKEIHISANELKMHQ